MPVILDRTMGAIAQRYDDRRAKILAAIREGQTSASMSGIEYYPKPWIELNVADPADLNTISTALTWNGTAHDATELRRFTAAEMEARARLMATFHEQISPERTAKIRAIEDEIRTLRTSHDR